MEAENADCPCLKPEYDHAAYESRYLGMDRRYYGDVHVQVCRRCARIWLHYHYENEAFSESGRWYRGLISQKTLDVLTAENALEILSKLDWHYCGGSWYGGKVIRSSGPPDIWP